MSRFSPYQLKEEPIILKELVLDCGIRQADLARHVGLARTTINLMINRSYIPSTIVGFKTKIEALLFQNPRVQQWLTHRGIEIHDIWQPHNADIKWRKPAGSGNRIAASRASRSMIPGDPDKITIQWEVEMVKTEALKHFKLFRNPFIDDVLKDSDIFMSDEHRYLEHAMLDCAHHGGFLAVIGEVGSGKSIMRRKVIEQLRKDGDVLIVYPQMIDKGRLNAASICDAIIMDISSEKPKIKLEQKTRQVQRLLLDRSKNNFRAVLIIEEAHDINVQTLKYLKRFYELEDGYRKLLGIILIGQTELKTFFDESMHVDMREVIRRVQIAEIAGLNGSLKDYLALKFKRVGVDITLIFAADAFEALKNRLTSKDRQNKTISHAYPLLVNNYTAKAMNMAFDMGEKLVTADVINAL